MMRLRRHELSGCQESRQPIACAGLVEGIDLEDNAVVTLSATPPKQVASRAKLILASFDPLHPSAQIAFSEFLSLVDRAGHRDRLVEAIFVFNDQHRQPEFGLWAHGNRDLVPGHGRYLEFWHQVGPLARQFITPKPRKIKQNPMPERRKPPARVGRRSLRTAVSPDRDDKRARRISVLGWGRVARTPPSMPEPWQ